ncbi:MAG: hypothetical protein ACT4NU_06605 [Chromatiales bacterium]
MSMRLSEWRLSLAVLTVLALAGALPVTAAEQGGDIAAAPAEESTGAAQVAAEVGPAGPADDAGGETVEGSAEPYSEAETILWLTDQLKNIAKPSRLKYEFRKTGTLEEGFTDSVQLEITDLLPDGMKKANVNFFTGTRRHYVPPYESINGNPLLAIYLHGDVLEMKRLTDGGWRYFHRSIKTAFAEAAEITAVEVDFNGRRVRAKQVKVMPYVDDPHAETSEKFHKLKDKVYLVTVSDDVPGYLYEIRTIVPPSKGAQEPGQPLLEESLKLVAVEDL